jgi:hypothetical protein
MTGALVDTSVWIDFFQDKATPQAKRLEEMLVAKEKICICGVILTEVLQGFRNDHDYHRALFLFDPLNFLLMERKTFIRAAGLYRILRRQGITIRNSVDCIIAAVAIENDVALLHQDRDFDLIAESSPLKVIGA